MADIGPFVEISRIQSEINRLFDNLLELKSSGTEGTGEWLPNADVFETSEELVVKFEVPGVSLKELTLTMNGNNLVLRGEKKRSEILQMEVLEPAMCVLDETDSGLDIDALRIVAEGVNAQLSPELGVLLITHYQRILNYIKPDVVHIMLNGRIAETGGADLALKLEERGYDWIREKHGEKVPA